MRKKNRLPLFWLGLAGGMALGRWLMSERRVPNLDQWQRAMAKDRGELVAAQIAARVRARYEQLFASRPHFGSLALCLHLEKVILPGLALYQVLLDEHGDQDRALDEVQTLFGVAFGQLGPGMARLEHLPGVFNLFRWLARRVVEYAFPAEGWRIRWVQDDDEALAFDVQGCIYLDVLTSYGAPELAPLFCWVDDLAFESLPPWISWERTGTLARGDDCCDFRWVNRRQGA